MAEYDELVKALRETDFGDVCVLCESELCRGKDCVIIQAADAIEELSKKYLASEVDNINLTGWLAEEHAKHLWIPVTERLPEDAKDVLVWVSIGKAPIVAYDVDSYNAHAKRWVYFENDVTHWMPLPTPPTAEEGE